MAIHRDCGGCASGDHRRHDGTRTGHPDVIGGQVCMCNGDCDARAAEREASRVALAEVLRDATTTTPAFSHADELARVTAERDAARDEVTRLDAELTGVRASLVEQAEAAEDARGALAMRTRQLREAQAERDAAVAALARVEALAEGLIVGPSGIGPEDERLLVDLTEAQACDTGELTNDLSHTASTVRQWLLDALAGFEGDAGTAAAPAATDDAEGRQIGVQGVHVDRAPDPRPQQIIDDPAGWFDAAREKARRDIRDQERR